MDLSGKKFGTLTVLRRLQNRGEKIVWLCRCSCGTETAICSGNLKVVKSCGCLKGFKAGNVVGLKHGGSHSATYKIWVGIKTRCFDTKHHSYQRYGARGITMCDSWRDSFEAFLADMGPRPDGLTIDRIDNDRGYELSNCRWATMAQQAANRRPHEIKRLSGSAHPRYRITPEIKEQIRYLLAAGASSSEAARVLGVSAATASRVNRGEL